ncbi:hypothetical protein IVA93_37465 (plasmid) [Bradyrhizobium sp. 155]|nr:hypothetical protein [Bradyrhizobium sp. 155]UPK15801.1 hypothetical protein IVA93_37465 [Bradyrhizobium sp. 155]
MNKPAVKLNLRMQLTAKVRLRIVKGIAILTALGSREGISCETLEAC